MTALIFPDAEELASQGGDTGANRTSDVIGEIVAAVNRNLADYKRIAIWEIVDTEFEKTASRKIKRLLYQ